MYCPVGLSCRIYRLHLCPIYGLNRSNSILTLNWIVWIIAVWLNRIAWNRNVFDKLYLHLNCVLLLNWIVWNGTVFDIETLLTLNWIVWYRTKSVLILNCITWIRTVWIIWIVWNRADYLHKNGFGVKQPTKVDNPTKPSHFWVFLPIHETDYIWIQYLRG